MLKFFPIRDKRSSKDRLQSQLMIMAGLLLVAYALILSLAPTIRYHSERVNYRLDHWLSIVIWFGIFSFLHSQTTKQLPNRDPYLLPIVALLTGLGLMSIWRLFPDLGIKQTIWLVIASLVVFICFQFPNFLSVLRRYKYIWLLLGLILTALTIILGENPTGAGPKLWLKIFGIYLQPSEPLKLLLIAFLAAYFTDRPVIRYRFFENFFPTIIITGMALLLLVSQRDLGTASIFLMIYLSMLYTAQGKKYILIISPILIALAGLLGYFVIDVVQVRINTWLFPFVDPSGAAYQVIQSMIAIGEGGMIGTGPGMGSPGLIPVSISDFIFSAIAEELGLFGITAIILLFLFLVYRGIKIALSTPKTNHRYLALGLIFYIGIQAILIIGGNIGFLPLTGVTLPYVSYGGSSLVVSFAALLILLKISNHTNGNNGKSIIRQSRYGFIGTGLMLVMILEIIACSTLSFWRRDDLINRAENPRWIVYDRFVTRGDILDRNQQIIITNIGQIGEFQRAIQHVPLTPVLGYTSGTYGQTGIESSMYPYLRGLQGYPYADLFWNELLYNLPPEGLDIRLTIDLFQQRKADALLGDENGAIILLNAESGEILVMASHPYFDSTNLEENWQTLIENEDAPLINRATQGKYPPGTTLLPFIMTPLTDQINSAANPTSLLFQNGDLPACIDNVDSIDNWQQISSLNCAEVQSRLIEKLAPETLLTLYENLGFTSKPAIRLSVAEPEDFDEIGHLAGFFMGQTDIKISPLQMAIAASALSNHGIIPAPRIVNGYQAPDGSWISLPKLTEDQTAIPQYQADYVNQLLATPEQPFWQITASEITEDGQTITWLVAGTTETWQGQPLLVVVVLESDNIEKATQIGLTLLQETIH